MGEGLSGLLQGQWAVVSLEWWVSEIGSLQVDFTTS